MSASLVKTDLSNKNLIAIVNAGSATLKFGLAPPGKMLIGPPALVYKGPVAQTFEAKVSAK